MNFANHFESILSYFLSFQRSLPFRRAYCVEDFPVPHREKVLQRKDWGWSTEVHVIIRGRLRLCFLYGSLKNPQQPIDAKDQFRELTDQQRTAILISGGKLIHDGIHVSAAIFVGW